MYIFDSVKREKLKFEPIFPDRVSIYVCGPTVYDDAHLGHAKSALSFDLLSRTLREAGYSVTLCRNFTDIDDKIIKKLRDSDMELVELTSYYIDRYLEDMRALKVIDATIQPKATESIGAIESFILKLIDGGFAYRVESGDIYFDTSKDRSYGTLSRQVVDDDSSQSRVENSSLKRNQKDFVLWKACQAGDDICFSSHFSRGRPGWHIECSAMVEKHFKGDGEFSIDIHGGGADLLFPHHENESSQTRCATGHELAKYWVHNGFVQIDGEKMSKSLGNSFFVKDALSVYGGEVLRNYLISIHYRNDFNFNEEDLIASKKRLDRVYRLKKRVYGGKPSREPNREFKRRLLTAMEDDLNISVALSVVDEMVNYANDKLDREPKDKGFKRDVLANIEFIDRLLGIG
ncbi:MAG: cysteine--tRNA ligase, partial [Epsilonproteobacteria bacterium]|nr:cysteine--tRNA ligase [Campylobacterota bacterium]